MNLAEEAQKRAKELRERLRHPPNAVPDTEVDLKRPPKGFCFQEKKRLELEEAVKEYRRIPQRPLSVKLILRTVSEHFGMGIRDLLGRDHRPKCCLARHIAVHLAHQHTTLSSSEIGRRLGGRDHSTTRNSRLRMIHLLADDSDVVELVQTIENSLLTRSSACPTGIEP